MAVLAFYKCEIRNQVSECAEDLNLKPEGARKLPGARNPVSGALMGRSWASL